MDDGAYKAISDLYKLLKEKEGKLDEPTVTYMTGVLKTLADLYYQPPVEQERGILDTIMRRKKETR